MGHPRGSPWRATPNRLRPRHHASAGIAGWSGRLRSTRARAHAHARTDRPRLPVRRPSGRPLLPSAADQLLSPRRDRSSGPCALVLPAAMRRPPAGVHQGVKGAQRDSATHSRALVAGSPWPNKTARRRRPKTTPHAGNKGPRTRADRSRDTGRARRRLAPTAKSAPTAELKVALAFLRFHLLLDGNRGLR